MYRGYEKPNERGVKEQRYNFDKGTTPWTKEAIREMIVREGESYISKDRRSNIDSLQHTFRRP